MSHLHILLADRDGLEFLLNEYNRKPMVGWERLVLATSFVTCIDLKRILHVFSFCILIVVLCLTCHVEDLLNDGTMEQKGK